MAFLTKNATFERGRCHIYIYASNPTAWAIFRRENVKEQRERRKTMAEKGKDKKEEKTSKHEKPPPFWWGCFVAIFDYKTGDVFRFFTNICPPSGVRAIYIYIYIFMHAVKLLSGPSLGFLEVVIWSK